MKRMLLALIVLTVGMLFVSSCNDPSQIGAELLEGDQANIIHTDSVTLNTLTTKEDSVLVFDPDPEFHISKYFIGDFEDPVFGNVKSSLYVQLWPNGVPDFNNAILDSVVLLLRYDSTNIYGDLSSNPQRLGVYRLSENMDLERTYYSRDSFPYDMVNPLGETGDFIPKYSSADTLVIIDYASSEPDTLTMPAHLRIPLSEDFGNELLNIDSADYASASEFLKLFNGIVVKSLNTTGGILCFDLTSTFSNLTIFYHTEDDQDTVYQQFSYVSPQSGVKFSNFKHNFTNSIVEDGDFFNNGDSLVFIQSMSGPNIKIDFPYADKLGDIIVNKAELIFTFAELNEDDITTYSPFDRGIIATEDKTDGGFALISDVILGGTSFFGGEAIETLDNEGNEIIIYKYNIASHFQQIVEGSRESAIFIRSFPKQERAKRGIFYGSKHSKYPVKFNLTYTKLDP